LGIRCMQLTKKPTSLNIIISSHQDGNWRTCSEYIQVYSKWIKYMYYFIEISIIHFSCSLLINYCNFHRCWKFICLCCVSCDC
jgi:hypothetical protein